MKENKRFYGRTIVASVLLMMILAVGGLSTFSVFIPRIIESTGISLTAISLLTSFSMGASFITNFFTPQALKVLGPKRMIIVTTIVMPLQIFIYSISTNIWTMYAGAIVSGVGISFLTVSASVIITNWYIENRNSMIGLVFSGTGFGGVVFILLAGYLIENFGWRASYQYLALIMFGIMFVISVFGIKEDPKDIGQVPFGYKNQPDVPQQEASYDVDTSADYVSRMKKSPIFWLLFIGLVAGGTTNGGLITFIPTYWQSKGMDPTLSSVYAGLISLIGGFSNMMAGMITEKFGARFLVTYTAIAFVASVIVFITTPIQPFYIILSIILIGLAYPTTSIVPPTITLSIFGTVGYTGLIGPLTGAVQLGSMAICPVLGIIFSRAGMVPGFTLLGILGIVELFLINFTFRIDSVGQVNDAKA